jgi:branched-chain amino acid transport system substrate-binding protein
VRRFQNLALGSVPRLRAFCWVAALVVLTAGCADQSIGTAIPTFLGGPRPITTPQPAPPPVVATPAPEPVGPPVEAAPQEPVVAQPIEPVPESPSLTPPAAGLALRAPGEGGPVRAAILLPLSGPNAALGQALLRAAQMALFEVGDEHFVLLPRDTEGQPEGAVHAAEQALADGAELVLGPVFSAEVQAAAQVTRSRNVPMIAFSTDREAAGNGVFLMGFMPDQQVLRVMTYAARQGTQRFAALIPDTPYGMAVANAMRRGSRELGVEFSQQESYAGNVTDFTDPVRRVANHERRRAQLAQQRRELEAQKDEVAQQALERLKGQETAGELGYDALLIAEGGDRLRSIGALLPFYDIDPRNVRFLGTGLWDDPNVGREQALVGSWFAGPSPADFETFRNRYRQMFGAADVLPRIASLAYDATALAAVLARGDVRANYSQETLTNPSGFAGVDGIFRFGADGIAERGLAIIEVQRNGLRVVSPPPPSFEALTN